MVIYILSLNEEQQQLEIHFLLFMFKFTTTSQEETFNKTDLSPSSDKKEAQGPSRRSGDGRTNGEVGCRKGATPTGNQVEESHGPT